MKRILFTDLDDTLFQSFRKEMPDDRSIPLAYLADGSAISYANPQQQATLALFQREMTVIPVTARNHDAFKRVCIPFVAEAVLNYGGIILNCDGQPDEAWLKTSQEQAEQSKSDLLQWVNVLIAENERMKLDLRIRLISDFGVPFYVVAKSKSSNVDSVAAAATFCAYKRTQTELPDVVIHVNNNNLAILPKWLDKRNAVDYLRKRYLSAHRNLLTFGMGDSLVDINFIRACDYMIVPAASQIANARLGEAQ